MTNDAGQEWSCSTCTFINKPLFLACDMCGCPKPSQGPTPPRRQPSFEPEFGSSISDLEFDPADDVSSIDSIVNDLMIDHQNNNNFHVSSNTLNNGSGGIDRAPRRVERHRSISPQFGTLIMTDDPADYERQDGKKKEEVQEAAAAAAAEQDHRRSRRLQDDPSLDDEDLSSSVSEEDDSCTDPNMEVSLNHHQIFEEPHRHRDTHMRRPIRTASGDSVAQERYDHLRPLPEAVPSTPTSCRRQRQFSSSTSSLPTSRENYARRPSHGTTASSTVLPYAASKFGNSLNTLPTQLMGSSSQRLSYDGMDGSMDDGSYLSSLESGSRAGNSRMCQSQPHHVQNMPRQYMSSLVDHSSLPSVSSRRDVMSQSAPYLSHHGYAASTTTSSSHASRQQSPTFSQHHRPTQRCDGLPAMLPRETASRRGTYSNFGNSSSRRLISDHHSVATTPYGGAAATSSSDCGSVSRRSAATLPLQSQHQQQAPQKRESLRRNAQLSSLRSLAQQQESTRSVANNNNTGGGDFIESVLPSIAPPPVPVLDSPTDVNVMAVFQKDRVAERRRIVNSAYNTTTKANDIHQATVRGRKLARAAMLDSVAKSGAFGSSSLGGCSSLSSASAATSSSSRHLGRTIKNDTGAHPFASIPAGDQKKPAAVPVPVVAAPRRKEGKKRLKGGIRAVMASMRIKAKN